MSQSATNASLATSLLALLLGVATCVRAEDVPSTSAIALRWAPVHYQDVDRTGPNALGGRSDYITAVDYDGDWKTLNNWEHAAKFPLKAHCYFSVVSTKTHWFIVYAFYHPRDWSELGMIGAHENDMEGLLAIVRRPGKGEGQFGELVGIVTVAHLDFWSYVPKGSPLGANKQTVDGELPMEKLQDGKHPITAQESKGHGLRVPPHVEIKGGDGIRYVPTLDTAGEPTNPNDRDVKYKLVDIFAEGGLWAHRADKDVFAEPGVFRGDNGGSNKANAPWKWDDHDDGSELKGGELALDPAKLVSIYFSGLGEFAKSYESNPYR